MRRLMIFLLLLVASVWLGLAIVRHPGYLFLVYQPWMVQMPLWFALLSLVLIFIVFYLLIDSVDRVQFMWFRIKNWLRFRRQHKFYSKTQYGLTLLIEGRWKKAERLLLAGVSQTGEPLINYLAAAKAAQEQQAFERRDKYIQKAYEIAPHADLAIGLTQAELELSHDQLEHAAATLNHLKQLQPRHPRVLKLLEKVYIRLADWKNLLVILPNLRKAKVLTSQQVELFEKNIYSEIIKANSIKNLNDLHSVWNSVPKAVRKNPDVVAAYIKRLIAFQSPLIVGSETEKEIQQLIRKTLKHHYQPQLVNIYGILPFVSVNRQLVIAGAWLKMYGSQPEILLLLARLCVREKLWGKAKDYFEKCLALGPNAQASLEYGKLLEELGELDEATQQYRLGLIAAAAEKNETSPLKNSRQLLS